MQPELHYISEGRSGYIVYRDAEGDINFYYEFGGGRCVAIITIPSQEEWTSTLNRRPEEREPILNFVARQAVRHQTPGSSYLLKDGFIEIYK